jgi:predicted dehydrogenase
MGLVGPGFVGARRLDPVRRLGFEDVVVVADASADAARAKAMALHFARAHESMEAPVHEPPTPWWV